MNTRQKILSIYEAAVNAVHPKHLLKNYLSADTTSFRIGKTVYQRNQVSRLVVIAAGKAAASMALEAERLLGNAITYGICVTKHEHVLALQQIVLHEAGHPLPDEESVHAAKLVMQMIEGSSENDIVLVLLSGGASSLIADMPYGCSLNDYRQLNELLINCGANIHEINSVRKEIATLKGGRLTINAYPATVITLAISDVLHDDISMIGSGLTVPGKTTCNDAINILHNYGLWNKLPASIKNYLENQLAQEQTREQKSNAEYFKKSQYYLMAGNNTAVDGAYHKALQLGYNAVVFKKNLSGDTEKQARLLVQQLKDFRGKTPACLILGGETTVEVTGNGKGGRCQHFVLAAMNELLRQGGADLQNTITILAAGTDGTDGPTDAAGALFDDSVAKAADLKQLSVSKYLQAFDAYHFFLATGGLLKTKPTLTNAADIILFIVE